MPVFWNTVYMLTVAAPARPMRSAGAPLLFVPRVRTELARWAFSAAGPTDFNSLTYKIRLSHSIDIFKRHLKTHLFYDAYTVSAAKRLSIQGYYRRYINAVFYLFVFINRTYVVQAAVLCVSTSIFVAVVLRKVAEGLRFWLESMRFLHGVAIYGTAQNRCFERHKWERDTV